MALLIVGLALAWSFYRVVIVPVNPPRRPTGHSRTVSRKTTLYYDWSAK